MKELNDEGVVNLLIAINAQAAKDYMKALRNMWKVKDKSNWQYGKYKSEVDELEKYFKEMSLEHVKDACYKEAKRKHELSLRKNKTA